MEKLDISWELGFAGRDAGDFFKAVAALPVLEAVLAIVPARDAAGAVVVALAGCFAVLPFEPVFAVVLAAEFTLFFAEVLTAFVVALAGAATFFEAGLSVSLTVFITLLATAFRMDFFCGRLAVLFFDGATVFTAALFLLLAAALLVADLVTVAFMVGLHYSTARYLEPHRAPGVTLFDVFCQTTTPLLNLIKPR